MNIFRKLGLFTRGLKAIKELNTLKKENNDTVNELIQIINDSINILERLKRIVPEIGEFIDEVIAIVKKWLKK